MKKLLLTLAMLTVAVNSYGMFSDMEIRFQDDQQIINPYGVSAIAKETLEYLYNKPKILIKKYTTEYTYYDVDLSKQKFIKAFDKIALTKYKNKYIIQITRVFPDKTKTIVFDSSKKKYKVITPHMPHTQDRNKKINKLMASIKAKIKSLYKEQNLTKLEKRLKKKLFKKTKKRDYTDIKIKTYTYTKQK
ncbi:hypothetical protein ACFLYU_02755 [Candidatus Dependentiae bacterium]